MDYPESVRFLYALGNESKNIKLGLDRMRAVCDALGNPERRLRFAHVAGTNGKGSVCAMIEAGLRASGLRRTGLFTSPHLISPTERICIDGVPVSEEAFAGAFAQVHHAVESFDDHPTYFETVTAMALLLFADAECGFVVFEVGLGGRLDATNVVAPAICAITPVSFDHQSYLGNSLSEIAREKAGILKRGVPAVIAPQVPEAMAIIQQQAEAQGAPLHFAAGEELGYAPALLGDHQITNAKTARAVLRLLGTGDDAIREGITGTSWPGRLERVREQPEIFLDGAHNQAGAAALADFIREYGAGRKVWLVFGVMRDKQIEPIAQSLFPLADELILTAPGMDRAMPPDEIPAPSSRRIAATTADALRVIKAEAAPRDLVFITGSLFLVGEARALLVP